MVAAGTEVLVKVDGVDWCQNFMVAWFMIKKCLIKWTAVSGCCEADSITRGNWRNIFAMSAKVEENENSKESYIRLVKLLEGKHAKTKIEA